MKLTAAQAKERILSGNIEGDHEVIEDLDMSKCTIATWPHWKFQSVNLQKANIKELGGSFVFVDCTDSTLERIDPAMQVSKNSLGESAAFYHCKNLLQVRGNFAGSSEWRSSGIRSIDPNTQFGRDQHGNSAFFDNCKQLQVARGNFPGFTQWRGGGITQIDPATKFGVHNNGTSADFSQCIYLNKICAQFPGATRWNDSGITCFDPKCRFGTNQAGESLSVVGCLLQPTLAPKPQGRIIGNLEFSIKAPPLVGMDF